MHVPECDVLLCFNNFGTRMYTCDNLGFRLQLEVSVKSVKQNSISNFRSSKHVRCRCRWSVEERVDYTSTEQCQCAHVSTSKHVTQEPDAVTVAYGSGPRRDCCRTGRTRQHPQRTLRQALGEAHRRSPHRRMMRVVTCESVPA